MTASTGMDAIGMAVEVVITGLHSEQVLLGDAEIIVVVIISNAEDKYINVYAYNSDLSWNHMW